MEMEWIETELKPPNVERDGANMGRILRLLWRFLGHLNRV